MGEHNNTLKKGMWSLLAGIITGMILGLLAVVLLFRMTYTVSVLPMLFIVAVLLGTVRISDHLYTAIAEKWIVHLLAALIGAFISFLYVHAVAMESHTALVMNLRSLEVFVAVLAVNAVIDVLAKRKEKDV